MKTEHIANEDFSNGTDAPTKLSPIVKEEVSEFLSMFKAMRIARRHYLFIRKVDTEGSLEFHEIYWALVLAALKEMQKFSDMRLKSRARNLIFNFNKTHKAKIGMGL